MIRKSKCHLKNLNPWPKKWKKKDLNELEDAFWASFSSKKPMPYGIDNEISLFPDCCTTWNLNKFTPQESPIHINNGDQKMPGITEPYIYVGVALSAFGCHIEDDNLNSINFNHEGAKNIWYFG